jgi:hypothetical protein
MVVVEKYAQQPTLPLPMSTSDDVGDILTSAGFVSTVVRSGWDRGVGQSHLPWFVSSLQTGQPGGIPLFASTWLSRPLPKAQVFTDRPVLRRRSPSGFSLPRIAQLHRLPKRWQIHLDGRRTGSP